MKLAVPYVAGFFDGEGSISIWKGKRKGHKNPQYSLQVNISQKRPEILRLIKHQFGGRIHNVGRTHMLLFKTAGAVAFLRALRPYLIVKAPQADIAILYQKHVLSNARKRLTLDEIVLRDKARQLIRIFNSTPQHTFNRLKTGNENMVEVKCALV